MSICESKITFVCCVESGYLETHAVRMVESLKRWGGRFANAPLFAVTPRFGPPISRKTLEIFEKYQVKHIYYHRDNKYTWNKFLNKLLALIAVEEVANTQFIGWLDSDVIFVDEPSHFHVDDKSVDFLACPSDKLNIATTGIDDPNDLYWQQVCKFIGLDINQLPFVKSQPEEIPIRFYFNSGVFVYRRSINFANDYLETFLRLCDSRIASQKDGFFFNDQIALGLTVAKLGISWNTLPYSHNFAIASKVPVDWYKQQYLQSAKIVHYHDAMWYWFWETLVNSISQTHPEVNEWLLNLGPMNNNAPIQWRVMKKMLDFVRKWQELNYYKNCFLI